MPRWTAKRTGWCSTGWWRTTACCCCATAATARPEPGPSVVRRLGGRVPGEQADLALEVGRVVELLVDAGEVDIGHLVDLGQGLEHGEAASLARHLATADEP